MIQKLLILALFLNKIITQTNIRYQSIQNQQIDNNDIELYQSETFNNIEYIRNLQEEVDPSFGETETKDPEVKESKPNTIFKETKQTEIKSDPVKYDFDESNTESEYLLQKSYFKIETKEDQNVIMSYTQKNSSTNQFESKTAQVDEQMEVKDVIVTTSGDQQQAEKIYPYSCSLGVTNTFLSLWTDAGTGNLYGQVMDGLSNEPLVINDPPTDTFFLIDEGNNQYINHGSSCKVFQDGRIIITWVQSQYVFEENEAKPPGGQLFFKIIDGVHYSDDESQYPNVKQKQRIDSESAFNRGGCSQVEVAILENSRFAVVFHQLLIVRVRIYDNIYHKRYETNGLEWIQAAKINQGKTPCIGSTSNGYVIGYVSNGNILHSAFHMEEDRPLFREGKDRGIVQEKASVDNSGVQIITFTEEQYMFVWSGTRSDGEYEEVQHASIQVKFYKSYNILDSQDTVLAYSKEYKYTSPQVTTLKGAYRRFMLAYVKESITDNSKKIEDLIYECEETCDICYTGGYEGIYCGECYGDKDPETDCVECLPAFEDVNGKCQCPFGFENNGNKGCTPCPDKKEGDGEGGCQCLTGLEQGDNDTCRPAFQFSDSNTSYLDGYGEPTSKRIETPPAKANRQLILIVVLCFSLMFIICCCYSEYLNVQRKKKLRKSRRKRNKKAKKPTPKEIFNKPINPNPQNPDPQPDPINNDENIQQKNETIKDENIIQKKEIDLNPQIITTPDIPGNGIIVKPNVEYKDSSFQVDQNELEPLKQDIEFQQTNIIIQPPPPENVIINKKNLTFNQAFEIQIDIKQEKPSPQKNRFIINDLDDYGNENKEEIQVEKKDRQIIDDLDNYGDQQQIEDKKVEINTKNIFSTQIQKKEITQEQEYEDMQEDEFQVEEVKQEDIYQQQQQQQKEINIKQEVQDQKQKQDNFMIQQQNQTIYKEEIQQKQQIDNANQSSSASGEFEWEEQVYQF